LIPVGYSSVSRTQWTVSPLVVVVADQVDDHAVAGQVPPAPVHGDLGEQPVFDLVKAPG